MAAARPGLPAAGPTREFEFTAADFARIRALIHQRAGIALSDEKQDMVYSRLARRLRACGCASFAEYLSRLSRGDEREWQSFVNSLTTNLTSFFREAHHFETLAQQLTRAPERPVRIWCAAASTGEEAYSLAITACETFRTLAPPVAIVASDIDTSVLDVGRQGRYSAQRVECLSPERVRQFFKRDGTDADVFRVRPELVRLVTFLPINLLAPSWPLSGRFDAIFCRNVMIYFDKPSQYAILERFHPLLREGGRLYAGHSESFPQAAGLFRCIGRTIYERVGR